MTAPGLIQSGGGDIAMISCYLRYVVDPYKVDEFEHYGRLWIGIVKRFGGHHHGYFLPAEGPNNIAVAMFTFPSLADYERYRAAAAEDEESRAAYAFASQSRCILSFERSFLRPILPDEKDSGAENRSSKPPGQSDPTEEP
jgi:NIPSNAP protein